MRRVPLIKLLARTAALVTPRCAQCAAGKPCRTAVLASVNLTSAYDAHFIGNP